MIEDDEELLLSDWCGMSEGFPERSMSLVHIREGMENLSDDTKLSNNLLHC